MKALGGVFNQEKALVGAFSVITKLRMELFEALVASVQAAGSSGGGCSAVYSPSQATGTCKLLASCLPTSQDNLATDGAATHGIKWFSSIGQVSAKVSGV